ncbi:MAG TPA: hypothetical protein GXX33_03525 [Firmicutes bacterium]|nr:hypothetical protein [Bacillota bacterium]
MTKKISVLLMFTLTVTLLFSVYSAAEGAEKPANEFRSSFYFTPDGSHFSFDGLVFPFNVNLSPNTGLNCGLEFGATGVNALAYYYHNNLFQQDQLAVGLLPLTWAAGKSVTLTNSLALQTFGRYVNTAFFNRQPCGVGLKYTVQLGAATFAASLTNNPLWDPAEKPLDVVTRLSLQAGENLTAGVGIATSDTFSDHSNFGFLVDAAYTAARVGFLGEFVSWNRAVSDKTVSGLYLEGFYGFTDQAQVYAGVFLANELTDDCLVLGGKHQVNSNLAYQAELCNKKDDWRLTLQMQVQF